jgi:hypothetical protein
VVLGQGDGTFVAPQILSVASNGLGTLTLADLNADGVSDLIVTGFDFTSFTPSVRVLLRQGNDPAAPVQSFTVAEDAMVRAVADLDGDTLLDLVTTSSAGDGALRVGRGDGTFAEARAVAAGIRPEVLVVADVNTDGSLDLVIAEGQSESVVVLLGQGDGTFGAVQTFAVGSTPVALAVLDVNGDGQPDLTTANRSTNSVSVLLGRGDGTFADVQLFAVGHGPVAISAADLNADGLPDLVTANLLSADVSVLLGRGDGTFAAARAFVAGRNPEAPEAIEVVDVNADGVPDLVLTSLGSAVSVLLGHGDGTFGSVQAFATGLFPAATAVADVNADGQPDVIVAGSQVVGEALPLTSQAAISLLLHR